MIKGRHSFLLKHSAISFNVSSVILRKMGSGVRLTNSNLQHQLISLQHQSFHTSTNNLSKEVANSGNIPKTDKKSSKILPIGGSLLIGISLGLYGYNTFADDTPTEFLSPNKFIPFVITNKHDIDNDHYLIEVTPKFDKWQKNKDLDIWNGNRMWSVEVKQPQIMVVRRYTPLPLKFTNENGDINIQVQDSASDHGKLVFYIKKYEQGEVARWIYRKPIGSVLELRGPYIEFEFPNNENSIVERPKLENTLTTIEADPAYPIKPYNLAFFAGGTGIAPALQLLLSKNPFKGFVDLYYSRKTGSEAPISSLLDDLEKINRLKVHHLVQEKKQKLTLKQITKPVTPKVQQVEYSQVFKTALEQADYLKREQRDGSSLALVCGPDGYVTYVAGPKPYESQGAVGGLLREKGWDESNVFKM